MNGRFRLKAREGLDVPDRKRTYNERHFAESLREFPDRHRLRGIFRENRFEVLTERRFFLGITGLVLLRPI